MKPSISYSSSLCKPLGKEPESRGGTPDVGQIAVDAVSRDKATKAPAVDSTAHLFDHLRGRVGPRSERRIRLDDRGQPDVGDARVLPWAAPDHLFHMFEPRQMQQLLLLLNTTRTHSAAAAAAAQHNAHNLRTPKLLLLLLFNTTRTTSGPPSTGAAIAMDGGVADTQPAITQAVSRRRF